MKKAFYICFLIASLFLYSGRVLAADDAVKILGQACEKVNANDAKSAVRVRAADKANFFAVSRLHSLNDARNTLGEHDFNVLVYNIVDEFIEDSNVKTISQNNDEVCVEVSGYVNNDNVSKAFSRYVEDDEDSEENIQKVVENVKAIIPTNTENVEKTANNVSVKAIDTKETKKKTLVYVEPVEFYNNTASDKYSDFIKKQFNNNQYLSLTDKREVASYTIKPKVLKVKTNAINDETSRLQMVLSLSVKAIDEKMEITEFQNRFVLFSKEENEQNVARGLMQKLFKAAGDKILNRIENNEKKKANYLPEVITPVKQGSYQE